MSDKTSKGRRKRNISKPTSAGASSRGLSSDPMDLALLERMVKLMSQHDLSTVDVRNGDKRVVLKRGSAATPPGPSVLFTAPPPPATSANAAPPPPPPPSATAPAPAGGSGPTASADGEAGLLAIKSPMVGTFYAAPSPDAKPFVQVGSVVDEDTDVCVIEAMKVFNTIKAECRGTIAKVLVSNGSTVEFGQVLFLVKP